MKISKKKIEQKNKGIILVALVVTIVVLLILAGITVTYVIGDNSVFEKASEAKLKTNIAQWQERLETAKMPVMIEGLGTFNPDKYFNYIEEQEIINNKTKDVIDNGNGTYEVTTKPDYVFEIELIPVKEEPKDIKIEYLGQMGKLPPKIKSITVTGKAGASIDVAVEVARLDNGKLSYYYRESSDDNSKEYIEVKKEVTDLTATLTGLQEGKIYDIKVVVKNKNGEHSLVAKEAIQQLVKTIALDKTSVTMEKNKTLQLKATVLPENAENKKLEWSSSNEEIAMVDEKGVVTTKENGNVIIKVKSTDGGEAEANCNVKVAVLATSISLNKTTETVAKGSMKILVATVLPENTTNKTVKWESSNTNIATVDSNGVVTGKTTGSTTITATTTDGTNKSASCTVTVPAITTAIELNSVRARIATGYTRWLTATAIPSNASQEFEWTSSNTNVATVDNKGKITAKAIGTTTITVKTKDGTNLSKTCSVTVASGVDITTLTSIQSSNRVARDNYGNLITIPGGFKVLTSQATNVTQGIVIQDNEGNEFVWVPIDSISKGANVRADDIRLGRYDNFTTKDVSGNYVPKQDADNYTQIVTINSYYQELTSNSGNTAAKSLSTFISKSKVNGGYYLGRFEASYKNSSRCYSKKSTSIRNRDSTTLTSGMVWNFIIQSDAATIARNSFTSSYVDSDLVNSYSWDTAIIFIQKYSGNSNYADEKIKFSITNTGATNDKVCNIYEMASNFNEWSTEYSVSNISGTLQPCVERGGTGLASGSYSSRRSSSPINSSDWTKSFRTLLYIK